MKTKIFGWIFILMLHVPFLLFGQDGKWSGAIDVQGYQLNMVFNIDSERCTLDVPAQGAYGISTEYSETQDGKVKISIPSIWATFEGKRQANQIVGTFRQHGFSLPLTLTPEVAERKRPQSPKAPFPYTEEEVTFSNGGATLSGTLTLPEKYGKETPVLLMVTGSGLQNRDEEMFGHRPFAVIADAFARRGIATLRYDDRGFGKSTGDIINCTTEDLKDDALAGIELLRRRFKHVGVIGHSEGGTIALMLAAAGKTDFIVSLAGGAVPFKEMLLWQNREALAISGEDEAEINRYVSALSLLYDSVIRGELPPAGYADGLSGTRQKSLSLSVSQLSTPYMRYFLSIDVSPLLGGITCPVMALNGTMDKQVDCEKNLGVLRKAFPSAPHRIEACKGLNHLFQHCKTGQDAEYEQIEETFSPEVIDSMGDWILGLF